MKDLLDRIGFHNTDCDCIHEKDIISFLFYHKITEKQVFFLYKRNGQKERLQI